MASARSGGRAGPRDEETNGEPDRSLQQMLRAIAEERSRAGLRQEISGLGESAAGASLRSWRGEGGSGAPGPGGPRRERGPPAPPRPRVGQSPGSVCAAGGGGRETCCVLPGGAAVTGMGPSPFPSPESRGEQLSAPLSEMPLEKNGQKAPRT